MLTAQFIPYKNLKSTHYLHAAQCYITVHDFMVQRRLEPHFYDDPVLGESQSAFAIALSNGRNAIATSQTQEWRTFNIKLEPTLGTDASEKKVSRAELQAIANLLDIPFERMFAVDDSLNWVD